MKVLIGMAVHNSKDYAMKKWIENVSKLQKAYPADFLMVDNSLGLQYHKRLKEYCQKYQVKNYKIEHIELPPQQERFERIARSREVIRKEVLSKDYDAWFSWESDILLPINALNDLVKIIQSGDYLAVAHNNWAREVPGMPNFDWGVALISREALEKYSFMLEFGTDPEMPNTYEPSEAWFRKRILRDGGSFIEVDGVINPVIHLNN